MLSPFLPLCPPVPRVGAHGQGSGPEPWWEGGREQARPAPESDLSWVDESDWVDEGSEWARGGVSTLR